MVDTAEDIVDKVIRLYDVIMRRTTRTSDMALHWAYWHVVQRDIKTPTDAFNVWNTSRGVQLTPSRFRYGWVDTIRKSPAVRKAIIKMVFVKRPDICDLIEAELTARRQDFIRRYGLIRAEKELAMLAWF